MLRESELELEEVKGVSLTLRDGCLMGVVGRVASGKSSLLATILGETTLLGGQLAVNGRCAYVEQEPCILPDSVQANIAFGLPLDEGRLREVIEVCHLSKDIEGFPQGLSTLIGERGVNISGGQRARISLARACYSQADIYLLDDPLSAVDPEVAEGIFRDCVRGYLREKAVLLVTHQLRFLPKMDKIVVLESGEQVFCGSYTAFQTSAQDLFNAESTLDSLALEERDSALKEWVLRERTQSPPLHQTLPIRRGTRREENKEP